ncbi:MAG: DNA methyltransferase [Gammaproteobacteria bacterium]
MFPEDFVAKQVLAYTERGEWVFDPFSGRGTTVFESLLNGRPAAGTDINPVAACVGGAKADTPTLSSVLARLDALESALKVMPAPAESISNSEFFKWCFHANTLSEVLFLRANLDWRGSKTDRFIAAVALGCLHGESHKTPNCLSNRMPRTISTKPDYSVRWWSERGLCPPERKTFDVLRTMVKFRLRDTRPTLAGEVKLGDARLSGKAFPSLWERVSLIVTSPPYLDTTDYNEDQWLRLWFLGGADEPHGGLNRDDRYTRLDAYWKFLCENWAGVQPLVKRGTHVVVRIGGTRVPKQDLLDGVLVSLKSGFTGYRVKPLHGGATTEIRNRQTNVFRPGTSAKRFEHDFTFKVTD